MQQTELDFTKRSEMSGCWAILAVTVDAPLVARFDGPDYNPALDDERLTKQIGRVYDIMKDGSWRPLDGIQWAIEHRFNTKDPLTSISAQIRHLRKPRFGGYNIERKREGNLWLYRMAV